jgi:hypothetical protein
MAAVFFAIRVSILFPGFSVAGVMTSGSMFNDQRARMPESSVPTYAPLYNDINCIRFPISRKTKYFLHPLHSVLHKRLLTHQF